MKKQPATNNKTHSHLAKLAPVALLSICLGMIPGYLLLHPAKGAAQASSNSGKILSGTYWIGGTGMAIVVQGNQYYYSDESGQTQWQPISRLKFIQDGVFFGEGHYWCLSTLPGAAGQCTPLGWTNPKTEQEARCYEVLSTTHQKILQVKHLTSLKLAPTPVAVRYPDHPTDRPDGYQFLMNGKGGYTVLASSELMMRMSSAIISNCPRVSMVSFAATPEGMATYGLVNKKLQLFDCYEAYNLEQSPNPNPPWGYEACYP